jgi:hypothetical protein
MRSLSVTAKSAAWSMQNSLAGAVLNLHDEGLRACELVTLNGVSDEFQLVLGYALLNEVPIALLAVQTQRVSGSDALAVAGPGVVFRRRNQSRAPG